MKILRTGFGVGDILLATGVLKALRRVNGRKYIVETRFPELFENNPDVSAIWREGARQEVIGKFFDYRGVWRIGNALNAFFENSTLKCGYPFPCKGKHLIDAMAESVGVELQPEERRPFMYLTQEEREAQSWARGWIAVQSCSSTYWTPNKNWVPGRMQQVVDELRMRGFSLVQLGSREDEPLRDVKNMRGMLTLRETAAILANAKLFVGLEGGLVHVARAVDTQSVVIYSGYTQPEETGYVENANLRDRNAGESCWKRERCEHCFSAASDISAEIVIDAVLSNLQASVTKTMNPCQVN